MSITKLRELGVMIDCSRNAVISVPALKNFIKIIAEFGYDYVGLYTEDTIEVEGEPYFGYQRGRLTASEIKEADAFAREHGMELRPYIQTLAHINQIVDYADYADIIDVNDILLVGDPKTEELLDHILETVSKVYSSKVVNIGMDEAHMVGLGKYLEKHGYENRVDIILKHLNMVVGLCKKHGLKPQMWSDMFFRILSGGEYGTEDEAAAKALTDEFKKNVKIPEGLELVYWDYYSTEKSHYESILAQHKALTPNISFAGGAWRWMGFTPYNSYSIIITEAAMEACLAQDIDSCVMTMWGDDGTECSIYSVLPVLLVAAGKGGKLPKGCDAKELFKEVTGYTTDEFMLLDIANPGCEGKKKNNLSKILLFNDPLLGVFDSLVPENVSDYYEKAAEKLKAVTSNQERAFDAIFRTQEALCRVLAHKAELGIKLRKAYQGKDFETLKHIKEYDIPVLIVLLDKFYDEFKLQWKKEAKTFGFEVQTIRIGGLKQRLVDIEDLLEDYLITPGLKIEELETEPLPVGYWLHGVPIDEPEYGRYEKFVTTSRLTW
ncbi:MAG: beta-N-acetylhexosaminidase [Butyrivibrio sp.]|nr:beta-N-acetylhexosaminidase [Butyrivibrio sp.]